MPLDNDSAVSAISYPEGGKQHIYAFVNGGNHLYANYFDGTIWHWADHGGVPGGFQGALKHLNTPSAVTYLEGKQRIYVYVVGDDGLGGNVYLHVRYSDGKNWNWGDRGTPPKATLKQIPSAISYSEGGLEHFYAFVGASDHDLHVNYGDENTWKWADQGHPLPLINPSIDIGGKGTVTYSEGGKQRIYAFVAIGKRLYVNYWDGGWHWADQGNPFTAASNTSLTTLDSAITYSAGGVRFIHDFIIATDQRLYRNHWDGKNWDWYPHSAPAQTNVDRMIGAISYWDAALKQQRMYTFVTGYKQITDRHLYMNYWDGKGWQWEDRGKPSNLGSDMLTGTGSVITFNQNGKQIIYAFANATNGHLYVNYSDGSNWHWADQGKP